MTKLDKAVEIVRGWSDEYLRDYISLTFCPKDFELGSQCKCCPECDEGWNEEVEE